MHAARTGKRTGPAQAVKVDGSLFGVGALCAAGAQWGLCDGTFIVSLDVDLAVHDVVAVPSVGILARCSLGEVAIRPASKVDRLPAAVGCLYSGKQTVPLFLVTGLGIRTQRRGAIGEVRGDGLRPEGR